MYAASRTAGFIASGQRVWVRYDAFPHQKFGMAEGEIAAISRSPIALQDLPPGLQATEPLYRITVTLSRQSVDAYGETVTLKPGMTLQADVLQDRRAIWEWLLEPVIAASGILKIIGTTSSRRSTPVNQRANWVTALRVEDSE